ncbi:MAG: DNA repair protein RecO [Candidatus Staskawiczbacteria bacterium]|nr:DNA repair protein RecO [Candidatus Staskawiczbacteria bacterium]
MATHYTTQGFVFKKKDRADADRIFSVFTNDFGRIEIFAKSIRAIASKLKGGIEVFCVSDIEFIQGKNHKTLTSALLTEKFSNMVTVPEKMEVFAKVACLLDDFIKEQETDQNVYNLVINFFKTLNACLLPTSGYRLMYYYFFWNFASIMGYKPELFKCAHCSLGLDSANLYFSNKEGGIICKSCFLKLGNAKEINADVVKILRLFLKNDWQTMLKLKIQSASYKLLQEISDNYGNYLSGILA